MNHQRRQLLAVLGVGVVTTLAGCGGKSDDGSSISSPVGGDSQSETTTAVKRTFGSSGEAEALTDSSQAESPLPTEQSAKLIPADGDSGDNFGISVGVSGDGSTAIIGAIRDEDSNGVEVGSAYVFSRPGGGWQIKLAATDGDNVDRFGSSVGVSDDGTTAIIGADFDEDPNGTGAGSAYLFRRGDGSWQERAKLAASDGDSDDNFGDSVGISGDGNTVVVGASQDEDPNGTGAGSAYVFRRINGSWQERAKLAASDGDSDDNFGSSISISGDGNTVVIGADFGRDIDAGEVGSVYVFTQAGGNWQQQAKLAASDGDNGDRFGSSVDVSSDGTTAIIGADFDEDPNGRAAGSTYAFTRMSGGWQEQAKLAAGDGNSGDRFGSSVGVSNDGNTAVIGAFGDENPNGRAAGSAYVFTRGSGSWEEQAKLTADDGDRNDLFSEVGVSGDGSTAIIGAAFDEDPNGRVAGSAYVFK